MLREGRRAAVGVDLGVSARIPRDELPKVIPVVVDGVAIVIFLVLPALAEVMSDALLN
jgi:hypothetical protein